MVRFHLPNLHLFSPTSMRKIEGSFDTIGGAIRHVGSDAGKVLDSGASAISREAKTLSSPVFTYVALGVGGIVVYYVITSKTGGAKVPKF